MKKSSTYFLLCILLCAVFVGVSSSSSFAQVTNTKSEGFGVSWVPPESPERASEQLQEYEDMGFTVLELSHPVSQFILDTLANFSFDVYIRTDKRFLTTTKLYSVSSLLEHDYERVVQFYSDFNFVKAIGLYSHSQSFSDEFVSEFSSILNALQQKTTLPLYEITTRSLTSPLNFSIVEVNSDLIPTKRASVLFSKNYDRSDFKTVQELIRSQELVLFDSGWLSTALTDYKPFRTAIIDSKNSNTFLLPLPQEEPKDLPFNWAVSIFLLIWLSVGIHIRLVPTYKELITRYFIGHRFFVEDIMRYRERSLVSGIFLFFQHATFFGLVVYIVCASYISELGIKALYYSLSQLAIVGQNYFSLFIIGFTLACFIQLIGLLWLYLPSKSLTYFSQALNLYTWIFHLDFILVSVMLVLILTGSTSILIFIFGVVFILSWLIGFLLTSFDSSKYLLKDRASYILYTFGLHSLVNIALVVLILTNQGVLDFLELIISI